MKKLKINTLYYRVETIAESVKLIPLKKPRKYNKKGVISPMPPLECDEEIKEGTGIIILTLLTY